MKHAAAHYDRADEYVDFARRVLVIMSSLLWNAVARRSFEGVRQDDHRAAGSVSATAEMQSLALCSRRVLKIGREDGARTDTAPDEREHE